MPIPYLKNKNKDQFWRDNKKKYYVARKNETAVSGSSRDNKKSLTSRFPILQDKKRLLIYAAAAFAGLCILGGVGFIWLSGGLPDPNKLINREVAQSTKIYDRTGETVLYEISGEQKRTLVGLNDIPDYVKWATIAIEDKNFYKHSGFSILAIFRTVVTNVIYGRKAGGSTLTQQFVKNAVLTNEKSYIRKIKELVLAYRMEKKFSKDEILQMYLNEIPYGSTAYGVEAASQKYFGKRVQDINLAEAAILAALPQAPSRYSPYGPNRDLLIARQLYILKIMVDQGYISQEQADEAKAYTLEFKQPTDKFTAPHFIMYVKELLADKYGEKTIEQGGLKIITTLDLYKQQAAEETVAEIAPNNEKKYGATNASLVSIDPKTGQILAMVGSRDYFNEDIDGQVNIATSKRQPGSSLKPLVYAAAFIKGYTPNTILYDVVTNFSTDPAQKYEPHNYDGAEHGPIPMKKALGGSLNIPAVKALYLAGVNNVIDLAQNLGYTTLNDRDRFGLALVLGGGEVELLEHTNAYSAFAREGELHPIASILRVEDKNGNVLEEFQDLKKQALDPKIARMVNGVLSDNSNRSWIFGEKNYLTLGSRPVGAKTGTTNDFHDAWTIGYTPSLVAGVWVGNSDNTAMKKGADGSMLAAPIWNKYMKRVLGDTPIENFNSAEIPKTGKAVLDGQTNLEDKVKIDRASGLLATEYTPASYIEEVVFNKPHCILYYISKDDPLGPVPTNPAADPQFNAWEGAVQAWAAKKESAATSTEAKAPTEYDNLHTLENRPLLNINTPQNNEVVTEPILKADIDASALRGINRVEYFINDNPLDTVYSDPFDLQRDISFLANGLYNLKIKACDDIDNCTEKNIEFNLIVSNNTITNKDVSVELLEPTSGLALNNIDFPLPITISFSNYNAIAGVNFYYVNHNNDKAVKIASTKNPSSNKTTIRWEETPESGTYSIYCEVSTWDKRSIKTPEINITVNNTPSSDKQ